MEGIWRIAGRGEEICLVPWGQTPPPDVAQEIPGWIAERCLDEWLDRGSCRVGGRHQQVLGDLYGSLGRGAASVADPLALTAFWRRAVGEALAEGRLRAFRLPRGGAGAVPEGEEDKAEALTAADHSIDFIFKYADGTPYGDVDYVWVEPGGTRSDAKLPGNGEIHKAGLRPGRYIVVLKGIERVTWRESRILCDDEATIAVWTSGYSDGTPAKIHVYRERLETPADRLATIDAQIVGDRAEVRWKYDYLRDDMTKAEQGLARFIAEVELDGGKTWQKTPGALEVELKTIVEARFTLDRAEEGKPVNLELQTLGFKNGTAANIELWCDDWAAGDRKLADLGRVVLERGRSKLVWTSQCPPRGDDDPRPEPRPQYAVVKIRDQVSREAPTGNQVTVHASGAAAT